MISYVGWEGVLRVYRDSELLFEIVSASPVLSARLGVVVMEAIL